MFRAVARAGFEERRFDAGEVELNYAVSPPRDEALVLIPGQTMCWESYVRVLPALAARFQVYAVDIRGHGKSGWTPGRYSYSSVGQDLARLLEHVVERPAIVSGNSSGGVLAVWLAANAPDHVKAIVPEDPPLFTSEWPRLRDDMWAHSFFAHAVKHLDKEPRDFGAFFAEFEVPVEGSERIMRFPKPAAKVVSWIMSAYRARDPRAPIDVKIFPLQVRLLIKSMSMYDVSFTKAFVDGSACDFSHEDALARVRCPMLLLHADWFRHPQLKIVGAMSEDDARRSCALVPGSRYQRVRGAHMIHMDRPKEFIGYIHEAAG